MANPNLCAFCGEPVTGKQRIRNSKGKYACMDCAEERREELRRRGIVLPTGEDGLSEADLAEILSTIEIQPMSEVAARPRCAHCRSPIGQDAVICVKCGHAVVGDVKLVTRVESKKKPGRR